MTVTQIYKIFDIFDLDTSGSVEFDEFFLLTCILISIKDNKAKHFLYRHWRTCFELLDADGSKSVSRREFETLGFLFVFSSKAVNKIYKEFDVSGNSELDYNEFRLFVLAALDMQADMERRARLKYRSTATNGTTETDETLNPFDLDDELMDAPARVRKQKYPNWIYSLYDWWRQQWYGEDDEISKGRKRKKPKKGTTDKKVTFEEQKGWSKFLNPLNLLGGNGQGGGSGAAQFIRRFSRVWPLPVNLNEPPRVPEQSRPSDQNGLRGEPILRTTVIEEEDEADADETAPRIEIQADDYSNNIQQEAPLINVQPDPEDSNNQYQQK